MFEQSGWGWCKPTESIIGFPQEVPPEVARILEQAYGCQVAIAHPWDSPLPRSTTLDVFKESHCDG